MEESYHSVVVKHQRKFIHVVEEVKNISILDAMYVSVKSYEDLSLNMVVNCFRQPGISKETQIAIIKDR